MALWGDKDSKTGGTITIVADDDTTVGTATATASVFNTTSTYNAALGHVGQYIVVGAERYVIVAITSDTVAKVKSGVDGANIVAQISQSFTFTELPAYVAAAECSSTSGDSGDAAKVYGVSVAEVTGGADNVVSVVVTDGGTKYTETPTVTFDPIGSTTDGNVTVADGVVSFNLTNGGSGYTSAPTVTFGAPFITFDCASDVDDTEETITYTGHLFETGDAVVYSAGGGTLIDPLEEGTTYYVVADVGTIQLAETYEDAIAGTPVIIDLDNTGVGASHTLTLTSGAATAVATLGSGNTVTHPGWVRRIVGTGGRAGRIQYETLVAGGTISGDVANDIQFPDA